MVYGEDTMKRFGSIEKSMAFGIPPRAQHAAVQERVAERPEQAQAAAWFWAGCVTIVIWSVSYLIRQPGVATSAATLPLSPVGDFALEGMLLALTWLGMLAATCLAVLTGVARVEES
jgi:hypothetical protein